MRPERVQQVSRTCAQRDMVVFRSFSVALENKNKNKNRNKMQSGDLQSDAAVVVNDAGVEAETSEGLAWRSAVESGPKLKVHFTWRRTMYREACIPYGRFKLCLLGWCISDWYFGSMREKIGKSLRRFSHNGVDAVPQLLATIDTRPTSFFAAHVKHLYFPLTVLLPAVQRMLSVCTGTSLPPDTGTLFATLPALTYLAVDFHALPNPDSDNPSMSAALVCLHGLVLMASTKADYWWVHQRLLHDSFAGARFFMCLRPVDDATWDVWWHVPDLFVDAEEALERRRVVAAAMVFESSVLITGTSIGFEAAQVPASLLILSLLQEEPTTDIVKLLDSRPEINTESVVGKKIDRAAPKGHIRLEGIHFQYPTRPGVRILRDFSIQAKPGTYITLVRASGCAKSTVLFWIISSAFDPIPEIWFGARARSVRFGHESFFLRDFLHWHSSRTHLGTHCHRAGPAA
ncbi:hypothetical protein B0H14DRAFT_3168754 [Mycena olivaceomarginata]|nr:hypothetical protein B0H14DRAFT_3168754 [Mycena olivaceomarginata]